MKIRDLIVLAIMTGTALLPPWAWHLDCTLNSFLWLWVTILSIFASFLIITYTSLNVWAKLFIAWSLFGCFMSSAPYLCLTMFWSLVACAVYFILASSVKDKTTFYAVAQGILFAVIALVILQQFGKDTLLNFNMKSPVVFGTVGNRMIFGSFVMCLSPLLLRSSALNLVPLWLLAFLSQSSGPVLSMAVGTAVYAVIRWKVKAYVVIACALVALGVAVMQNEFKTFVTYGRGPVWEKTIELSLKKPFGYGIATYRLLFPVLAPDIEPNKGAGMQEWEYENTKGKGLAWRRAHNTFLQILFEFGIPGAFFFIMFMISVVRGGGVEALSGFSIVGANALTAFPDRCINIVFVILVSLAFCHKGVTWKIKST